MDVVGDVPTTQGIKYAGSKLKLLPYILDLARRTDAKSALDGFSGSTRVSQAFAQSGYRVVSNDIAVWSEIFGQCYLLSDRPKDSYSTLIRSLNQVQPRDGWFTEHYGGEPNSGSSVQRDGLKRPWQIHNTRKLDGIRQEIDRLSLSPIERAVALTSLILGLDRVDSTLGHFVSYLQKWSPRSFHDLYLEVPDLVAYECQHDVRRGDIFDLADCDVDLAYFDPPMGQITKRCPRPAFGMRPIIMYGLPSVSMISRKYSVRQREGETPLIPSPGRCLRNSRGTHARADSLRLRPLNA